MMHENISKSIWWRIYIFSTLNCKLKNIQKQVIYLENDSQSIVPICKGDHEGDSIGSLFSNTNYFEHRWEEKMIRDGHNNLINDTLKFAEWYLIYGSGIFRWKQQQLQDVSFTLKVGRTWSCYPTLLEAYKIRKEGRLKT